MDNNFNNGNQYDPNNNPYGQQPQGQWNQGPTNQNGYQQNGNYQQNPYGQQNPYNQPVGPNGKKQGNGFGLAAMILGIISVVFFCSCINIPMAIVGIILAIVSITQYEEHTMGIIGLILCIISIVLFIGFYGLSIANDDFDDVIEDYYYTQDLDSTDAPNSVMDL